MLHYTVNNLNQLQKDQGFSLIELLVVVIIGGIMAAVAAPNLKGWYDQQQVNNSIMKVRTALEQARSNAVRLSNNCTVAVSSGTNSYSITGSPTGCVLETFSIPNTDIIVQKDGGSLPVSIIFDFKGETTAASNATFVISRRNGNSPIAGTGKCVVVSQPLGMIRFGNFNNGSCENLENLKYDAEN